jgi:6-phosphofructokinase 1
MGYYAVKLLAEGQSNRVVVVRGGKVTDLDITEALNMTRVFDKGLYEASKILSN